MHISFVIYFSLLAKHYMAIGIEVENLEHLISEFGYSEIALLTLQPQLTIVAFLVCL